MARVDYSAALKEYAARYNLKYRIESQANSDDGLAHVVVFKQTINNNVTQQVNVFQGSGKDKREAISNLNADFESRRGSL